MFLSVALSLVIVFLISGTGTFLYIHDSQHHMSVCPFGLMMEHGCAAKFFTHITHWANFLSSGIVDFIAFNTTVLIFVGIANLIALLLERERKKFIVNCRRSKPSTLCMLLFSSGILNPKKP